MKQLQRWCWTVRFKLDDVVEWLGSLRADGGQTVAEYALVLLVVAAIAVAFLVWAKTSGKLDTFFNKIFDKLVSSVDSNPSPTP